MELFKAAGKLAWGATKITAKVATMATGVAVKGTAEGVKVAYKHRDKIGSAAASSATVVVKATGLSAKVTAKASAATAKTLYKHREKIAGATVGTLKGTAGAMHDASAYLVSDESINTHIRTVEKQSRRYNQLTEQFDERLRTCRRRKNVLLDTLAVGGETLAAYMNASQVPADIQQAYELTYPNVAATLSFGDQVDRFNDQELMGFVSGIKGKLFEMQYVDYLNAGRLPAGFSAEMASSPTNPGWDIAIFGPDGAIHDAIQAKATDSASYVTEALVKNPHIDVVTTSEVHSHLMMQGFSESIINSGISDNALTAAIDGAVGDAATSMDWMPSAISFALIAFSAYNQEGLSVYEQSSQFGERSLKSYLAYLAGGSLAVATNTWWIGVIGGMGSRFILGEGQQKRDRLSQVKQLVRSNQIVINRLEKQLA